MLSKLKPLTRANPRGKIFVTASITTNPMGAPNPTACTHTNARDVSNWATQLQPAEINQLQLLKDYKPVTPVSYRVLGSLLLGHPNRTLVNYVVNGFKSGFSLLYQGPRLGRQPNNLKSAAQFKDKLAVRLRKEVTLGRMLGPFSSPPLHNLICSPIGMVPKKCSTEMRMITHFSFPEGQSINSYISPEDSKTKYQSFDTAVRLVAKLGKGAYMSKADVKSAFRNIPMCKEDLSLLGIKLDEQFYIDCCLPFGASTSCAIFEDVAGLIHWLAENTSKQQFVHYLDDFFTARQKAAWCKQVMQVFQDLCKEIGLPLAEDKYVPPTQIIEFLGLLIDTILMVVRVPADKIHSALKAINSYLKRRKCTSLQATQLAGLLNFCCTAVPFGRTFLRSLYTAAAGKPRHHHVDVCGELRKDLILWKFFLSKYSGWSPIIQQKNRVQTVIYTDAAKKDGLGWGIYCSSDGQWAHAVWDNDFIQQLDCSIDYLELLVIVIYVITHAHLLQNHKLFVFCDNTPAVQAVRLLSSTSTSMQALIRILATQAMVFNIKLIASHIPGRFNKFADLLSRQQVEQFLLMYPGKPAPQPWMPDARIWPISRKKLDGLLL